MFTGVSVGAFRPTPNFLLTLERAARHGSERPVQPVVHRNTKNGVSRRATGQENRKTLRPSTGFERGTETTIPYTRGFHQNPFNEVTETRKRREEIFL